MTLPVLKPLEPVAECGGCRRSIYPDSVCCARQDCPLRGDEWLHYQRARGMQDTSVDWNWRQNENATSPKVP